MLKDRRNKDIWSLDWLLLLAEENDLDIGFVELKDESSFKGNI